MVDGLHILTRTRTKKPLVTVLSGVGRGLRRRKNGGELTNVQYKPNQTSHTLYNEYILIKFFIIKKIKAGMANGQKKRRETSFGVFFPYYMLLLGCPDFPDCVLSTGPPSLIFKYLGQTQIPEEAPQSPILPGFPESTRVHSPLILDCRCISGYLQLELA
jgi:hypothetical protein